VGRSCATDDLVVEAGTLAGDQTLRACSSLFASGVQVISGKVALEAGNRVAFGSGFSVAADASLAVVTGPLTRGEGVIESRSPAGVASYQARFYVDPTGLDLGEGDTFEHFVARDAGGAPVLVLGLRRSAGSHRLFLEAYEDDGSWLTSEGIDELVLLPGWHSIAIAWQASSGANDGRAEACLDSEPGADSRCIVLPGLDNDEARIDSILWGAQATPRAAMGILDLDDFASWEGAP
jgi:hypothetical protein